MLDAQHAAEPFAPLPESSQAPAPAAQPFPVELLRLVFVVGWLRGKGVTLTTSVPDMDRLLNELDHWYSGGRLDPPEGYGALDIQAAIQELRAFATKPQ